MKKLWHKLSHTGLHHLSEEEIIFKHRETLILNRMTLVLISLILIYIPLEIILNGFVLMGIIIGEMLAISGVLIFNHYQKFEGAKWYFMSAVFLLIAPASLIVPHGSGNELLFIPGSTLGILLLKEKWKGILFMILVLATMIFVQTLRMYIEPLVDIPAHLVRGVYPIFSGMALVIVFFVVYYFKSTNEDYSQHIEEQKEHLRFSNELISEKNKEITDSINYAKKIQDVYLPPVEIFQNFFPDGFILFMPKDIVSGDFYWFYRHAAARQESSREQFIAVADCTGHGVPGAIMSIICCNALNEVAVTNNELETGKILDEVRHLVTRTLKSDRGSGRKDGMDISLARINMESGKLNYSGANNPIWIFRSASREWIKLNADKQPVGYFEKSHPFSTQAFQLEEDDLIYLFSDGYADQFGGDNALKRKSGGKKYKYTRMQEFLESIHLLPMEEQKLKLKNEIEKWMGDLEQVDDICIVGIRFKAEKNLKS